VAHDDPFAGKRVNADWAYYTSASGTYTPALTATTTNPTLGTDSTVTGIWHRSGHLLSVWVKIVFGSSGVIAGSGSYRVSLPFDVDLSIYPTLVVLGSGFAIDSGTNANREVLVPVTNDATTLRLNLDGAHGTQVTEAAPFTWAANDHLSVCVQYIADAADLP
jgi:hypothetical protein